MAAITAFAQPGALIVLDYERSAFNDNQPLPAATNFTITGPVNERVSMVECLVYSGGNYQKRDHLYRNTWKNSFAASDNAFYLPINYKLRGGEEYDFVINYYRQLTAEETDHLREQMYDLLDAYVGQQVQPGRNRVEFRKNPHQLIRDLNTIVRNGLTYYRNPNGIEFDGFSELAQGNFEQLRDRRLGRSRFVLNRSRDEARRVEYDEQMEIIRTTLYREVDVVINSGLSVIGDSKAILSYPVERTLNVITLHGGYGGVYFDGGIDDLDYGSGFFAGLTLPLGRKAFASKFWSRSALVTGVYIQNFQQDDREISGPIIQRPFYVGLGYKVFRFARLTAGATLLEDSQTAGGIDNLGDRIFVRPFVGLQIEINLWADLAQ